MDSDIHDLEAELGLEVDTPSDPDADARNLYELVRDVRLGRPTWAQLSEWKRQDFRAAARWPAELVAVIANVPLDPNTPAPPPVIGEARWAANRVYEIKLRHDKHEPLLIEARVAWADGDPTIERVATSFCQSLGQCPGCFSIALAEQRGLSDPYVAARMEEVCGGVFFDPEASAQRTHVRLRSLESALHRAGAMLLHTDDPAPVLPIEPRWDDDYTPET